MCLLQNVSLVELVYLVFTAGCIFGGVSVPCVYCRMYFWPNVCALCLLQNVPLVEFVCLVFIRMPGGSYRVLAESRRECWRVETLG